MTRKDERGWNEIKQHVSVAFTLHYSIPSDSLPVLLLLNDGRRITLAQTRPCAQARLTLFSAADGAVAVAVLLSIVADMIALRCAVLCSNENECELVCGCE